jgi:acetyl-CoA synthetase
MPMNARSVSIYLGAILAGCAVVSLADSLSRAQLLLRLNIGKAKVVFAAEFIQRNSKLVPLASRIADTSLPIILADGPGSIGGPSTDRVIAWDSFVQPDASEFIAYAEPSTAINILFSSGTTGEPKAIPWDHVTPIRAASDGHFHQDIHAGDVVAWPTSYGWMMGPWLTFAALINRGTIALFDGAPTGSAFGRFVQDAGVNIQGVVPTLVSRWRQSRCMEEFDWSAIRLFSSTGECSNPSDMQYLSDLANGKPVIEYCGGTEVGGGYISSTIVQPNLPSLFSTPTLGSEYLILDDHGRAADVGEAYLMSPALGMSRRLLNANHFDVYYRDVPAGPDQRTLRRHGDRLQRLPNGYTRILGRTDDTFNISGIKVSSVELERALGPLREVAEVAVIAVPQPGGGPNRLVACAGFGDKPRPDKNALQARMQTLISEMYSPLFKLDDLLICSRLPRTASNKINRREIRALYEQECGLNVGADDE